MQNELRMELLRDKKAEKIMADLKGAATIDQVKAMENAVSDSIKHVTFNAPAYVAALRSSEPVVSAYASVAETGKVSAPLKGISGVLVLQPYAKEKQNETFEDENEESSLAARYARMAAQQMLNDLYLKANVKDQRYLFF